MYTHKIRKTFLFNTVGYLFAMVIGFYFVRIGISRGFLFLSILWMLLSVLMYFFVKSLNGTKIFVILNFLISGLTIAAYYAEVNVDFKVYAIVLTTSVLFMFLEYIIIINAYNERTIAKYAITISGCLFVVFLFRWIGGDLVLGSAIVFSSVVIICMNISIYHYSYPNLNYDVLKAIKLSSMLMFGGVLTAIIAVISDGDIFDLPIEVMVGNKSKKRI